MTEFSEPHARLLEPRVPRTRARRSSRHASFRCAGRGLRYVATVRIPQIGQRANSPVKPRLNSTAQRHAEQKSSSKQSGSRSGHGGRWRERTEGPSCAISRPMIAADGLGGLTNPDWRRVVELIDFVGAGVATREWPEARGAATSDAPAARTRTGCSSSRRLFRGVGFVNTIALLIDGIGESDNVTEFLNAGVSEAPVRCVNMVGTTAVPGSRQSLPMNSDTPIDTAAAIRVAALREALRAFLRESELIAQANGLTPQRHLLLLMIKGAPDGSERSTVTQLAARLRLAQTTVTDLVRRAEDAGLVAREQSGVDARVAILRLTEEGEHRLARSFRAHDLERNQLLENAQEHGDQMPLRG